MKIICKYGDWSMAYIYLKPFTRDMLDDYELHKSEITEHVTPDKLTIPYYTDLEIVECLDKMTVKENTFKDEANRSFDTEYGNDMDNDGYIIGIELNLTTEKFIDLIEERAYRVIDTRWRDKEFRIITFDHLEKVVNPTNIIYKLTDREDVFVIAELQPQSEKSDNSELPEVLFKALISARDDIYPLDYLLNPEFILSPNDSYGIYNGYLMTSSDRFLFDALSPSHREEIREGIVCEKCGADHSTKFDCTINIDSPETLIAQLYCYSCRHRSVKRIGWNVIA